MHNLYLPTILEKMLLSARRFIQDVSTFPIAGYFPCTVIATPLWTGFPWQGEDFVGDFVP